MEARFTAASWRYYNALTTHMQGAVSHTGDLALVEECLQAVSGIKSNRAAAKELGVSEATLRRWRAGNVALPLRENTRDALTRYVARHRKPQGRSQSGGATPTAGEPRSPLDVSQLAENARRLYQELMGELFAAGCDHGTMVRASDILLAPIAAAPGMSEALQVRALRAMMAVVRAELELPTPDAIGTSGSEDDDSGGQAGTKAGRRMEGESSPPTTAPAGGWPTAPPTPDPQHEADVVDRLEAATEDLRRRRRRRA